MHKTSDWIACKVERHVKHESGVVPARFHIALVAARIGGRTSACLHDALLIWLITRTPLPRIRFFFSGHHGGPGTNSSVAGSGDQLHGDHQRHARPEGPDERDSAVERRHHCAVHIRCVSCVDVRTVCHVVHFRDEHEPVVLGFAMQRSERLQKLHKIRGESNSAFRDLIMTSLEFTGVIIRSRKAELDFPS